MLRSPPPPGEGKLFAGKQSFTWWSLDVNRPASGADRRWEAGSSDVGRERNSPLMLGGFLFLAIFCPLPSPRPPTRFLLLPPSSRNLLLAFQASFRSGAPALSSASSLLL